MDLIKVTLADPALIRELSIVATAIVRDYYDPLLGKEQNDYMLEKFQSEQAVTEQLNSGYRYYLVRDMDRYVGFMGFYPKPDCMYLSKLYLDGNSRGRGLGRQMLNFVIKEAKAENLPAVTLNVNKYNNTIQIYEAMGFRRIRAEKNDIGHGYYMDDYVYQLDL